MFGAARARALNSDIFLCCIKFGERSRAEIEDVAGQAADSGGGFDQNKRPRRAQQLPHFRELPRKQTSKDRMNIYTRVVVREPARARARVIAVNRMIETLPHEFGESNRAAGADAPGKNFSKGTSVFSRRG